MSVRDREDALVTRLHALAPHLDGEPDPAFRAATRARLVAMAAVRSPAPEPVPAWKRLFIRAEDTAPAPWRGRLTALLAGAAMAVTALSTLVAVSTDAVPGDTLYGLKRTTEQTQLALAGDARGQTLLGFARTRLHELEELTGSEVSALPAAGGETSVGTLVLAADADPRLVLETLATMDAQTAEGAAWLADRAVDTGDDAPLALLATWSADQSTALAELRDELPSSTVDEVDGSLGLLTAISARSVGLEDVLGCPAGVPIQSTDSLGPLPGLCLDDEQSTPPAAGGEGEPGSVPGAPGSGSEPTDGTTVDPSTPSGGSSAGGPGSEGSGDGSGEGPALPSVEVPTGEEPSVETPSLPLPSLPTTLPNLPGTSLPGTRLPVPSLPGTSTGTRASTSSAPALPSAPLDVDLCIGGVIVVGDCG